MGGGGCVGAGGCVGGGDVGEGVCEGVPMSMNPNLRFSVALRPQKPFTRFIRHGEPRTTTSGDFSFTQLSSASSQWMLSILIFPWSQGSTVSKAGCYKRLAIEQSLVIHWIPGTLCLALQPPAWRPLTCRLWPSSTASSLAPIDLPPMA